MADEGRVALVTGGTRGIGAAVSRALKGAGYRVGANYGGNDEAAAKFSGKTGIPVFKWDVSDPDACATGADEIVRALGPVEVLVNNAGITRDVMIHRMTVDQWNDVISVNLGSMFNMTRSVLGPMREAGFGRIINVGSINGQKGQMGQTNYAASKAGVAGFTKALALECARKAITVNCVAPGYIDTDMVANVPEKVRDQIVAGIPVGRLGLAEEVGRCVLFLARDNAGFMTGTTLTVNGGQFMAS